MIFWLVLMGGMMATACAYAGARTLTGAPAVAERFRRYAGQLDVVQERSTLTQNWVAFMVEPLAPILIRLLPTTYLSTVRTWMRQIARPTSGAFHAFLVGQTVAGLAGCVLGLTMGGRYSLGAAAAMSWVGVLLPAAVLKQIVRRRQRSIDRVLCDSLDLLTACVEAGLGLDAAIAQLVRRRTPACLEINQELGRYLHELRLGTARPDALRNLGTRAGVEDLRHVATALVHGDALGIGVSQVLRAQAKHLRMRRKQRAEEQAMKAPIKILFPLLFGIFPSIFVLILGPAVLRLLDSFIGKF